MYLISKVVNRLSWQRWGKEKVGRMKIEERGGRREGGGDISNPNTLPPSATSCSARSFLALPAAVRPSAGTHSQAIYQYM